MQIAQREIAEVNGKILAFFREDPEGPYYVSDDASYYHVFDNWYVHFGLVGDVVAAANLVGDGSGIETWDGALPQPWLDAHVAEVTKNGGWAIWVYRKGNLFGEPMFANELIERAKVNAAVALSYRLEEEDGD